MTAVKTLQEQEQQEPFAVRAARDYAAAQLEVRAAFADLNRLPKNTPPLAIAQAASRLERAAGRLWMHAHRVAETATVLAVALSLP